MIPLLVSKGFLSSDVNLAIMAVQVSLLVSILVISTLIQVLFPIGETQDKPSYFVEMRRSRAISTASSLNKLTVISVSGFFFSIISSVYSLAILDIGSLSLILVSIVLFGRLVISVNNDLINVIGKK